MGGLLVVGVSVALAIIPIITGQVVKVKVMEVNKELKRIGLGMKAVDGSGGKAAPRPSKKQATEKAAPKPASLSDLQAKFSRPKRRK